MFHYKVNGDGWTCRHNKVALTWLYKRVHYIQHIIVYIVTLLVTEILYTPLSPFTGPVQSTVSCIILYYVVVTGTKQQVFI